LIFGRLRCAGCDKSPTVVGKNGVEGAMLVLQFHIAVVVEDGKKSM
jgi:hypothetical protein